MHMIGGVRALCCHMVFTDSKYLSYSLLLLISAIWVTDSGSVHAQVSDSPISCETGVAEAYLDVGNVRAKILNNGGLFWNGGPNSYEVPKGGGVNAIFSTTLWLGGLVDGNLRMSASTFGPWEFWPGPIPDERAMTDACSGNDKMYPISREDLLSDGLPAYERVVNWPVDLGAPFMDADGDGQYNPQRGDKPELLGDAQVWWVMNDAGGEHLNTEAPPMNVEVRGTAFAFGAPGAVGNSTFYRYRLRNRSPSIITDAYVGLHVDPDVGSAGNDYMGSDSTLGMGYAYNAYSDDQQYGEAPPAVGFTVLRRPGSDVPGLPPGCSYADGKDMGFTNVMPWPRASGTLDYLYNAPQLFNLLQSRWLGGEPLTLGGHGYDFTTERILFAYPGDPTVGAYWTELARGYSPTGPIPPVDVRFVNGLGPFCIAPGEEVEVVFAIVWSRGEDHLDSVRHLREDVAYIQSIRDAILTPRALPGTDAVGEEPELPFATSVYPNPVGGAGRSGGGSVSAKVRFSTPEPLEVSVTVFNALGQRIHVAAEPTVVAAGNHSWPLPTATWLPGVYLVRITAGHAVTTRRLVVTSGT